MAWIYGRRILCLHKWCNYIFLCFHYFAFKILFHIFLRIIYLYAKPIIWSDFCVSLGRTNDPRRSIQRFQKIHWSVCTYTYVPSRKVTFTNCLLSPNWLIYDRSQGLQSTGFGMEIVTSCISWPRGIEKSRELVAKLRRAHESLECCLSG